MGANGCCGSCAAIASRYKASDSDQRPTRSFRRLSGGTPASGASPPPVPRCMRSRCRSSSACHGHGCLRQHQGRQQATVEIDHNGDVATVHLGGQYLAGSGGRDRPPSTAASAALPLSITVTRRSMPLFSCRPAPSAIPQPAIDERGGTDRDHDRRRVTDGECSVGAAQQDASVIMP
jgi:hypothetical protein